MVKKQQSTSEIHLIVQELRRVIKRSDYSQREVEEMAGFSKGYLSQLLAGNLDLKMWHVLAILRAFEISPVDFFERIYPNPARHRALEEFAASSAPVAADLDQALATLHRVGSESFHQLRERLAQLERAMAELAAKGLLEDLEDSPDQTAEA